MIRSTSEHQAAIEKLRGLKLAHAAMIADLEQSDLQGIAQGQALHIEMLELDSDIREFDRVMAIPAASSLSMLRTLAGMELVLLSAALLTAWVETRVQDASQLEQVRQICLSLSASLGGAIALGLLVNAAGFQRFLSRFLESKSVPERAR